MKKIFALALVLCMIFALTASAYADFAPNGPVNMIVAYKAGNGTDQTARILAKYAEKYIGQTIVIDNVDGGSGSIGWSKLAESDPDGMTIGFINLPNFNNSIVKELGTYKTDDFAAICNHVTETSIVVVRADDDRFPDLDALVAYGREKQGTKDELIASTNGNGASNHIGAQAFANSAEFTYIDVQQGNTADELLSLRGGEADFCVVKVADIASMANEVRILGVFSPERIKELPDVPTLAELGYYPDWLGSSRCIVAPAGVSEDVIKFYEEAFKATMEDPEYQEAAASFTTDFKDAKATGELIEQQQRFTESLSEGFWYDY
jgi:tripartite-type tricarboxylate transporter receptor subunit TctC